MHSFINKISKVWLLAAASIIIGLTGCTEHPVDNFESHERAITDFQMDNQIGVPEITREVDEAEVVVYVSPDTDLTSVAPDVTVSYKASVSPESGEEVNFADNDGEYTYIVTSESGRTRDWLVRVEDFDSNLAGKWEVTGVYFDYFFGDLDDPEDWSWGEEDRPLEWDLEEAEDLIGNEINFALEGVADDGNTFGTFTHEGATIDFGEFAFKFDLLPTEETSFQRDFGNDVLIFDEEDVETAPLEFSEDEQTLRIPFEVEQDIDWDNQDNLDAAYRFYYEMEKVE